MLFNMWDAFCSLGFTCGAFSNLCVSGECVHEQGSICACCVRTCGPHQGRHSIFSMRFHLVRQGTRVCDGLQLECSWPGARSNPCDLLVSPPPSILPSCHTWGLQAQTASTRCVPNTNWGTHKCILSLSVCTIHTNAQIYWEWMILILCMYFTLFSVLYWIFEQTEHLRRALSLHALFPLLFLRRLWSHLWHNSSISKPNTTVSTFETHRHCAGEGYVYAFFWKMSKFCLFFIFTLFLCLCLNIHIKVGQ